uniref:Uncharacterized protein n=1 Tax=Strigamia maritima TaxID=126957 RepID=T1II78_STRMM
MTSTANVKTRNNGKNSLLYVVSIVAGITAYVVSIVSICRLLTTYRKNVLGLRKQRQNQFILNVSENVSNNNSLMLSAIQFGGYQVAYLVSGRISYIFLIEPIFIFYIERIYNSIVFTQSFTLYSWRNYNSACTIRFLKVGEIVGSIVLVLVLIQMTQYLLIRYYFLEDKGDTMALDNRRGFFIMSYFVFFYNIFTGVFSCVRQKFSKV